MPSRRRCLKPTLFGRTAATLSLALLFPLLCQSIYLDIHVPLPQGCLKYHALLANRLLREASRPTAPPPTSQSKNDGENKVPQPSERVDLFSHHTPHVTLYLADFDLEVDTDVQKEDSAGIAKALNKTKVGAFLGTISSLNFTEIMDGWNCPLSFAKDQSTSAYYNINGAYAMLPIEDTPCLQTLSTKLLHSLQSYVRHPIVVPSWVASLPEPDRSSAIYRSRTYGSPNVLEGFDPHVTVGFDPTVSDSSPAKHDSVQSSLQWRVDTMKQWNDAYQLVRETCIDEVQGIALGKNGVGGTVLANSIMGYWGWSGDGNGSHNANRNGYFAVVE